MNKNIKLTHRLSEQQIFELMDLYSKESWCKDRKLEDVRNMLGNSWIIALIDCSDNSLIAFGRVLTDFVYRAFIYDVIVHGDYRGVGYGKFLVKEIVCHEDLKNVERIELNCIDRNVLFYNKLGFKKVPDGTNMMRFERTIEKNDNWRAGRTCSETSQKGSIN